MGDRDNNYNLMRCIAAALVLVAHSYTLLTGDPVNEPFTGELNKSVGSVAVDLFFVISGLLITGSLVRRPDVYSFTAARILRIFPALIAANVITVFVLGPLVTYLSAGDYFTDWGTYTYFIRNNLLLFNIQFDLPGVFTEVPYPTIVNGSLWTLPYELKLYGAIALTYYACGALTRRPQATLQWLVPCLTLSAALAWWCAPEVTGAAKAPSWLRLVFLFYLGASCYVWRHRITLNSVGLLPASVAVLTGMALGQVGVPLYGLGLAYWVFYLAYIPAGRIRAYNRLGDYSYGLYIFAFPVQQTLLLIWPNLGMAGMIAVSFGVTLLLAAASWYLVEAPSLAHKNGFAAWLRAPLGWTRGLAPAKGSAEG